MNTLLKEKAIVEAIHNDFDKAGEELLTEALSIINKGVDNESKAMRMKNVGFTSSEIVIKAEAQQKKVLENKKEAELVRYYQQNYPFLKFLKEEQLDDICKKYNLIYAPVSNYIGDVPERNLYEIELAQPLKSEDNPNSRFFFKLTKEAVFKGGDKAVFNLCKKGLFLEFNSERYNYSSFNYKGSPLSDFFKINNAHAFDCEVINVKGLFIAAPQSQFNLKKLKKKGVGFFKTQKIEPRDPVVFRYVRGGIQVLSKWGLEAYDEVLINPISN